MIYLAMVYESVDLYICFEISIQKHGEFVLKRADFIFIKCTDFPGTPSISHIIIKEILFLFTKFI